MDLYTAVDAEQARLMAEECIVVDNDDNVIGSGSKEKCTFASFYAHIGSLIDSLTILIHLHFFFFCRPFDEEH
jgi:isopentenyldiphosphate isomerase